MAGSLVHSLARAVLPIAERLSWDSLSSMPRPPENRAMVRGAGADPDRVLFAGNSLAVGWGVTSHGLAISGILARTTATITSRGVDMDVHAQPDKTIRMLQDFLTPDAIARYDAIVVMLGAREAFEFVPIDLWRTELAGLLDHIAAGRPEAPAVVIAGIDEITPVPVPRAAARRALRRIRALNAATAELVTDRDRVVFAPPTLLSPDDRGREFFGADPAAAFDRIAHTIAPLLAQTLEASSRREPRPLEEEERLAAVATVLESGVIGDPELVEIVETARRLLGGTDSALVLVDRDDIVPIVYDARGGGARPREGSISEIVLHHRGPLVVRDLTADPQFAGRGRSDAPVYRGYVGHVIESPTGHALGVLAIVDDEPRDFTPSELALVRAMALRVGELLFRDRPSRPS